MFALFVSLYYSMFNGAWHLFTQNEIYVCVESTFNGIGTLATTIFGNNQMTNLGNIFGTGISTGSILVAPYMFVPAFVLALITSIGIVVMAVKGVKKAFGIFFMGIRRW